MTLLQKHNAFPVLWNIYFVSGVSSKQLHFQYFWLPLRDMFVFKLPWSWVICHDTESFRELSFNRKLQKEKELLLTCARSFVLEQPENKEKHF